jgi:hypothetical protein
MARTKLVTPAVPSLPLGTEEYERRYQDQFTNILRLYFNELTSVFGVLVNNYTVGSTVYTIANLPDPAVVGAGVRTFVSDSSVTTFNANLVGGGTTTVPVYSDGTNWKVG